jgi:hypothetical protein
MVVRPLQSDRIQHHNRVVCLRTECTEIVTSGPANRTLLIVTQANLVPRRRQSYDARSLAQAGLEGRDAGKLFLEAQVQA